MHTDALSGSRHREAEAEGKDWASTSMVCVCPACSIRFVPQQHCPKCGLTTLFNLRDAASRAQFVKHLYRRVSPHTSRVSGPGVVLGLSGGFSIHLLLVGHSIGDAIAGGLVACAAGIAGFLWLRSGPHLVVEEHQLIRLSKRLRKAARLTPFPIHHDTGAPSINAEGVIRVIRPARAPISDRVCAGYRIVGESPSGPIDDAEIGEIEIVGEWGTARIEGDVLLRTPVALPRSVTPSSELLEFLYSRGVFPKNSTFSLAEARLVEGQRVHVHGRGELRTAARGLRNTEPVWVLDWARITSIHSEQPEIAER